MIPSKKIKVFLEQDAHRWPLSRRLLSKLQGISIESFSKFDPPPPVRGSWILKTMRGKWIRPCPGTRHYLCCGYWVINLALGCPFSCRYCIIPSYYGARGLTLFVNLEEAFKQLNRFLSHSPKGRRFGTGEWTDSLALEPILQTCGDFIRFFADQDKALLELKTKAVSVEGLLDLPHAGKTVVSWSINPQGLVTLLEPGTPTCEQRLHAARLCQQSGYPVGLHLDPMIWHDKWKANYLSLIELIADKLDPQRILWISMGALRYPPQLHERLLHCGIGAQELVPAPDGKRRYLRPMRVELFGHVNQWINNLLGDVFVYLCMESPSIWRDSMGWAPRDSEELDSHFRERIIRYLNTIR